MAANGVTPIRFLPVTIRRPASQAIPEPPIGTSTRRAHSRADAPRRRSTQQPIVTTTKIEARAAASQVRVDGVLGVHRPEVPEEGRRERRELDGVERVDPAEALRPELVAQAREPGEQGGRPEDDRRPGAGRRGAQLALDDEPDNARDCCKDEEVVRVGSGRRAGGEGGQPSEPGRSGSALEQKCEDEREERQRGIGTHLASVHDGLPGKRRQTPAIPAIQSGRKRRA